jgi:hypothetical protein
MKRALNIVFLIITVLSFMSLVTLAVLNRDNILLSTPMTFALILAGLFGSILVYANTTQGNDETNERNKI